MQFRTAHAVGYIWRRSAANGTHHRRRKMNLKPAPLFFAHGLRASRRRMRHSQMNPNEISAKKAIIAFKMRVIQNEPKTRGTSGRDMCVGTYPEKSSSSILSIGKGQPYSEIL